MEREEKIKVYEEKQTEAESLEKELQDEMKILVRGIIRKNECIHLGLEIPQYMNSARPVCLVNASGDRGSNDTYNWVSPKDCALCLKYKRNPDVETSIFLGIKV